MKIFNAFTELLAAIFEHLGLWLSRSRLFARMSNTTSVTYMSRSRVAMSVSSSLLKAVEIWAFLAGWALITTGLVCYILVRVGVTPYYDMAFAGTSLMVLGAIISMTIDYVRFAYAGKRWHIASFVPAAFVFMHSMQVMEKLEMISIHPMKAAVVFVAWLLLLQMVWMIYEEIRD